NTLAGKSGGWRLGRRMQHQRRSRGKMAETNSRKQNWCHVKLPIFFPMRCMNAVIAACAFFVLCPPASGQHEFLV
ncbi:MAG: hypothetical protein RSE46_05565, partial [Janthinobacterium sp.]